LFTFLCSYVCVNEQWSWPRIQHFPRQRYLRCLPEAARLLEATAERDIDKADARVRMARLHAGLAIVLVVEHNDGEIRRLLDTDGGEAAQSH
jgi:hypothetical protein